MPYVLFFRRRKMPIRKLRLSRLEEAEHLVCLRQLQAEGHDVEIPEQWPEKADALDIEVGPPLENMVFDVRNSGVVYYAIRARMMARRSEVILTDCEITPDWDDQVLLLNFDEGKILCKLGCLDFERREVLNSRLENQVRFHDRGEIVEGWILASGLEPIPNQYRTGAIAPCRLNFTDQFHHEIEVRAYLSVLRTSRQENASVRPPRSGLFDAGEKQKVDQVTFSHDRTPVPIVNMSRRNLDGRRT
jgi:hypothetical protein